MHCVAGAVHCHRVPRRGLSNEDKDPKFTLRNIHMTVGIRTLDLRKVYHSPPPFAAGAGGIVTNLISPRSRGRKRQRKPQIIALEGRSLELLLGATFGSLGPTGAGKATTVGIHTTRVRPTSGKAWSGEHDGWQPQVAVKRLLGVVGQRPNLDFSLTAFEILAFHGAYFGLSALERTERATALLD